MPNCDFYALGQDHLGILSHLLEAGECDIYELSSRSGQETLCFKTLADFEARYLIPAGDWTQVPETIHLQLHVRAAGGTVHHRRIQFTDTPSFCYSTEGWGLIQLYLRAPLRERLGPSHSNHNSAIRATTWRKTIKDMGDPDSWDWPLLTSFSRRLNSFIRRQAVAKQGSRVILPAAAEAKAKGLEFSLI
ncbi:hypothetical protein [Haloferula sp. BvORR071]|uniref:hypothetical protein n=1 Tax=Haloferula sp. BvORR071 TaxID=1396141 RepID=UPI0005502FA9|nr:hypothetical protein [Haloferula sp. BvORR071]